MPGSAAVPILDDPGPGLQWEVARVLTVDATGSTVVAWTPILEPTAAAWAQEHVEVWLPVLVALGALLARIRPILAWVGGVVRRGAPPT